MSTESKNQDHSRVQCVYGLGEVSLKEKNILLDSMDTQSTTSRKFMVDGD